MSDPTHFPATYADFRLVKTRSVAQIVLEVPIEQAQKVVDFLGLPMPGAEKWVAFVPFDGKDAREEAAAAKVETQERLLNGDGGPLIRCLACNTTGIDRFSNCHEPCPDCRGAGMIRPESVGCDCQAPDAETGARLVSMECPYHNELPPTEPTKPRTPFHELRRSQQAGILCDDRAFQEWFGQHCGWVCPDADECTLFLRKYLEIESRAELDDPVNGETIFEWDGLVSEYRQATGQVAEQRG